MKKALAILIIIGGAFFITPIAYASPDLDAYVAGGHLIIDGCTEPTLSFRLEVNNIFFANGTTSGCVGVTPVASTTIYQDIESATFAGNMTAIFTIRLYRSGSQVNEYGQVVLPVSTTTFSGGVTFITNLLPGLVYGVATTSALNLQQGFLSGGLSTTTIASFCEGISDGTLGGTFSYGLCKVSSYVFVPSPESVNQFSSLASTTRGVLPFGYIYKILDAWSSLVASSTQNAPTYSMNFGGLGLGSTTALGNVLPDITAFSSTTVKQYFPPGTFDLLKFLAGLAIFAVLFADIFFTIRNLLK